MDRQTLRDWVHRFNRRGVDGLIDIKAPGRRSKLYWEQREELRQLVEAGPDLDKDGVVRWRCVDLKRVLSERFGVDLSEVSLGRILKQLNFSRISARPRQPAQDDQAIPAFKKRAWADGPPVALETGCAILNRRGAAVKFLVDLTPLKNVAHGSLRTCEW